MAVASRRPARADGPKVGLDGPASLGAGRAPWAWRAGQARGYLCAEGGKAKFVAAADLFMLECTINAFG